MNAKASGITATPAPHRTGDKSLEAMRARISDYCDRFGVEPPQLRIRLGRIQMDTATLDWFETSGASLDWILSGDPLGMASTYRERYALRDVAPASPETAGALH